MKARIYIFLPDVSFCFNHIILYFFQFSIFFYQLFNNCPPHEKFKEFGTKETVRVDCHIFKTSYLESYQNSQGTDSFLVLLAMARPALSWSPSSGAWTGARTWPASATSSWPRWTHEARASRETACVTSCTTGWAPWRSRTRLQSSSRSRGHKIG